MSDALFETLHLWQSMLTVRGSEEKHHCLYLQHSNTHHLVIKQVSVYATFSYEKHLLH